MGRQELSANAARSVRHGASSASHARMARLGHSRVSLRRMRSAILCAKRSICATASINAAMCANGSRRRSALRTRAPTRARKMPGRNNKRPCRQERMRPSRRRAKRPARTTISCFTKRAMARSETSPRRRRQRDFTPAPRRTAAIHSNIANAQARSLAWRWAERWRLGRCMGASMRPPATGSDRSGSIPAFLAPASLGWSATPPAAHARPEAARSHFEDSVRLKDCRLEAGGPLRRRG